MALRAPPSLTLPAGGRELDRSCSCPCLYIALRLAFEIYADVKQYLKPHTPLFAKQLAPGLGLAEDPANGQSFGMNRCGMLAQAMVGAYRKGQQTQKTRMAELRTLFDQAGLNLDRPYLSLSSVDHYDRQ